jgi:hypothetical protein
MNLIEEMKMMFEGSIIAIDLDLTIHDTRLLDRNHPIQSRRNDRTLTSGLQVHSFAGFEQQNWILRPFPYRLEKRIDHTVGPAI